MKLLTAARMRELDRQAIEDIGIPGVVLMENAGRGAAERLCRHYGETFPGPVLILAGKGNNGGDGYVIARHLLNRGWQVRTLVLAEAETITGDASVNLDVLMRMGGEVTFVPDEHRLLTILGELGPVRLVVDAIFGTGLGAPVRGHYGRAIDWINESGRPVVAVDMPSGIEATQGALLGKAVRADLTLTFAAAKLGQALYPGRARVGTLEVLDIGIPAPLLAACEDDFRLVTAVEAAPLLPARPVTGHKGTFGHLLVVAGSRGKTGAAALTAEAGLRMGAGLVTLGCPLSVQTAMAIKLTEVMTAPQAETEGALALASWDELRELWQDKEALALGPGLGQLPETAELVRQLVRECPLPMVIDADGLNALGPHPSFFRELPDLQAVLTPHPGEMSRLTGTSVADIEADRVGAARRFALDYRVTLVLKGARTVVALPDGRVRINAGGNPGMASGGMGDALTGIIGGLLAQGLTTETAAILGVYLHALAGDRLAACQGNSGLFASDLLREIPAARAALAAGEVEDGFSRGFYSINEEISC
ncbi:NAD(P)H-hydrate dehydratase [Trichloromonas sp.]|uniref:NAD(P)H-hydrate dehydratase n=1 Tax=Trichloromonas sp. TaxID=3069249 RepID=UPI002A3E58A9|nr:NAD(P)H-hydrate dehydratase [Trichloromonas sp.]